MANPTNKQELLDTLRTEHAEWDALLNQVGANRMELRGVNGDWSVKDIVAHVTAWERRPVAWLDAIRAGTWPQPPEWALNLSEDEINAWIFALNRGRLLQDVLAESREVFKQLMRALENVSESDLTALNRFEWLGGNSLLTSIASDSYEHYLGHGQTIRAWLAQREPEPQREGAR